MRFQKFKKMINKYEIHVRKAVIKITKMRKLIQMHHYIIVRKLYRNSDKRNANRYTGQNYHKDIKDEETVSKESMYNSKKTSSSKFR